MGVTAQVPTFHTLLEAFLEVQSASCPTPNRPTGWVSPGDVSLGVNKSLCDPTKLSPALRAQRTSLDKLSPGKGRMDEAHGSLCRRYQA